MQIQINAATRLQAAKAKKEDVINYLEKTLKLKDSWFGIRSLRDNEVVVDLDVDFWEKAVKAVTKALGKPTTRKSFSAMAEPDEEAHEYVWKLKGTGAVTISYDLKTSKSGAVQPVAQLKLINFS
jgi:hypothetical protein